MLTGPQIDRVAPRLLVIQIISAAIVLGALAFALVACFLVDWNTVTGNVKMLTLGGAATGLMMFFLAMIVPRLTTASPAQIAAQLHSDADSIPIDDEKIVDTLLGNLAINRVISSAIIEGAVFLNLMAFFIEHSTAALVIAAIGILLLVISFPFRTTLVTRLGRDFKDVKSELDLMA